jgi:hypothetical protein
MSGDDPDKALDDLVYEAHHLIASLTNANMDEVATNTAHPYRKLSAFTRAAAMRYYSDMMIIRRKDDGERAADLFHYEGERLGYTRREFTARYPRATTYEKLSDGILHEEIGALIMLKALGLSYEEISEAGLIEGSPSTIYRRLSAAKLTPHHLPPMLDGEGILAAILARGHVRPVVIYILATWRFNEPITPHFPRSVWPLRPPLSVPMERHIAEALGETFRQVHLLRLIHRVASGGVIEGLSKADLEVLRRLATAASLPFDYDSVK